MKLQTLSCFYECFFIRTPWFGVWCCLFEWDFPLWWLETSDWTRLLEPSHHLALYSYPNALGHNGSIPDHCSYCSLCFSPESSVHVKWTEQMSTDLLNQRKLTPLRRGMEFIKGWEVIQRVPGKQMFGGNTGSYGVFFYWMMFNKLGSTFPVDLMPFQTQK